MLIATVESLIEQHYATVQPFPGLVQQIRSVLVAELETLTADTTAERTRQNKLIHKLSDERHKLLQAYYAGALAPIDEAWAPLSAKWAHEVARPVPRAVPTRRNPRHGGCRGFENVLDGGPSRGSLKPALHLGT